MDSTEITQFMPAPIRVVFADSSVTIRRLLKLVLSADSDLQICHGASNGAEAILNFAKYSPDVVLLDVEMAVRDGIEVVEAIRRNNKLMPIIMFSSLMLDGGNTTLEAMECGATDYVLKPPAYGHLESALGQIENELLPKIKRWGRWYQEVRQRQKSDLLMTRHMEGRPHQLTLPPQELQHKSSLVEAVAIGASTGGPNALAELLKSIPDDLSAPVLITLHMPAHCTGSFAERLDKICPLSVREGFDGALVEPGNIWIAPGNQHMVTKRVGTNVKLQIENGPPENSCRPSVDVMFRSVSQTYRDRMLAVVLTGMGEDGRRGCEQIRSHGGRVIVQDEASSVVWGMPGAVVKAGLAQATVPLSEMASAITKIVHRGRPAGTELGM